MKQICKLIGFFFTFCVFTATTLSAQTVKGKIVDENGEPIIGASVLEKGTQNGAISDVDGKFTLELKSGKSTLSISFVGYQAKEVKPDLQNDNVIKMQETTSELSEYVVVGYAKQKKATLTGAVSVVQGETLTQRAVASLSTSLEGTMPGVSVQQPSGQPGDDGAVIRVRGLASFNSDLNPLILVDGIEGDIDQLNMNDVESVSVLKDAASSSIYGSRASGGVILITTKRGNAGKTKVTYNGYLSSQVAVNMPQVVPAWQYLQGVLDSKDNAGISVSDLERSQTMEQIDYLKQYKPDNWNYYDTDWKSATMNKSALMQNHNVSVSGGNEDVKYYAAGSYLNQDGLLKANDSYNRATLRANADIQMKKWAKFSLETNLRQSNGTTPGVSTPKAIINEALYAVPTLSAVKELDGLWGYGKNGSNPVAKMMDSGENLNKSSEVMVTGTLTITPVKNLDLIGQYALRQATTRDHSYTKPYNVGLRGMAMGSYPPEDNLTESESETIKNYYRFQANYQFGINRHKFNLLGGMEIEDNTDNSFSASRKDFNMGLSYLDNGDPSTAGNGGGASDWAMVGYFGRLNYNYDDKYLLEGNIRYDGSSRFLPKNRWGLFPSVSAGWVISGESFMEAARDYLSQLKLRLSYGSLGNQNISQNYPGIVQISSGYGYWFGKQVSPGIVQTALSNPDITWETSTQFNGGLDLILWNGLLSLTADYYVKRVSNLLMEFPMPYYVGMGSAVSNAGRMENKGWEIQLSHRKKIGSFSYGATFTLNDNRNKVLSLSGGRIYPDNSVLVGYPYGGYWGYLTDGYYKDWDDVNNSIKISNAARPGYVKYKSLHMDWDEASQSWIAPLSINDKDKVYLGDPYPHFEYGLRLDCAWHGFDLSAFLQGVGKRKAYMSGIGLKPFANGSNLFTHQLDSWTPDNPNAAYPILVPENNSSDNFVMSDKWVRDGSYMRLKNVVLGYNIPNAICSKLQIASIRVYASGQNLLTLSNFYKGYDPEVAYGGSLGGEFYPIMQTYTFGLDVTF